MVNVFEIQLDFVLIANLLFQTIRNVDPIQLSIISATGSTQQRYQTRHRNCQKSPSGCVFLNFTPSQTPARLCDLFWGEDSNRVLELFVREIVFSQQIDMRPRDHGMGDDSHQKTVFSLLGLCLRKFLGQVEIVPADDAVLDQAVADFGDFLRFFFGLGELSRITNYDSPGEPIRGAEPIPAKSRSTIIDRRLRAASKINGLCNPPIGLLLPQRLAYIGPHYVKMIVSS